MKKNWTEKVSSAAAMACAQELRARNLKEALPAPPGTAGKSGAGRGDMLFESVTLHRRFPYATLGGFFILDKDAAHDGTLRRRSTFENAHQRFTLFTGRNDPAGRDEQYERLWIVLLDANPFQPSFEVYAVPDSTTPVTLESAFDELIDIVPDRNPDFYENRNGSLRRL